MCMLVDCKPFTPIVIHDLVLKCIHCGENYSLVDFRGLYIGDEEKDSEIRHILEPRLKYTCQNCKKELRRVSLPCFYRFDLTRAVIESKATFIYQEE